MATADKKAADKADSEFVTTEGAVDTVATTEGTGEPDAFDITIPEATVKASTTETVETTSATESPSDDITVEQMAAALFVGTGRGAYSDDLVKRLYSFTSMPDSGFTVAVVRDVIAYANNNGANTIPGQMAAAKHAQLINSIAGLFINVDKDFTEGIYLILDFIGENIENNGAFTADRVHRYNDTAFNASLRIRAVTFVEYLMAIAPKKSRLVAMRQLDVKAASQYLFAIFGESEAGQGAVNKFVTTFHRGA